jgi:hypothetical protein
MIDSSNKALTNKQNFLKLVSDEKSDTMEQIQWRNENRLW